MEFRDLYQLERGTSVIETVMGVPRETIKEFLYHPNEELQQQGVQSCCLKNYDIVCGDYETGVRYQTDQGIYYMFLSANSKHAFPQQLAIGTVQDGRVYLMREDFPVVRNLGFFAFPEEVIGQSKIRGFIPRCYWDNLSYFTKKDEDASIDWQVMNGQTKQCFQLGLEGIKAFGSLMKEMIKVKETGKTNDWTSNLLWEEVSFQLSDDTKLALQRSEHFGCEICQNMGCTVPTREKLEQGAGENCIGFDNPKALGKAYVKKYHK